MTERARKLLAEAMDLSPEERTELVEGLLALSPEDDCAPEEVAELERRARRARAEPDGGEPWAVVRERLRTRLVVG